MAWSLNQADPIEPGHSRSYHFFSRLSEPVLTSYLGFSGNQTGWVYHLEGQKKKRSYLCRNYLARVILGYVLLRWWGLLCYCSMNMSYDLSFFDVVVITVTSCPRLDLPHL